MPNLQVSIWSKPRLKVGQGPEFRNSRASSQTTLLWRFTMYRVRLAVATYASETMPVRPSSTTTPRCCASQSRNAG